MNEVARIIRRARREAAITIGLDRLTVQLRSLHAGTVPADAARGIVTRYARLIGVRLGPEAADEIAAFLATPRAARMSVGDLDQVICVMDESPV